MASSRRPSEWYESWMRDTSQESAAGIRKSEATKLLQAIKDRDYGAQTLEEIILVLDFENLGLGLSLNTQNVPILDSNFECAIAIAMVGDFADHLSSCLVQFIRSSSNFERELQCRALLSVFALLQLHGVKAQQAESYTKWQDQLNRRFQDLVWSPDDTAELSPELFHKTQCSCLLSLGAAYAQKFIRAEPISTAFLAIGMDIMQLSLVTLSAAMGTGGAGLVPSLQDLNSNISRLLQSPDSQYHDLFELQGLTRIAVALQLYSRAGSQSASGHHHGDDLNSGALERAERVAVVVLRQVLHITTLASNERFETEVRPPSRVREQMLALLNRGPARLDKYNYLYGLLDCASQLVGIIDPMSYPDGLLARMKLIIVRSREASFRWKAVGRFIPKNSDAKTSTAHPKSRSQQIQMILVEADHQHNPESRLPTRTQLYSEIDVICECLRGDSNSGHKPSVSSQSIEMMNHEDWREEDMCASNYLLQSKRLQISLPRGPFYKRVRFLTAGLSTFCSYVYFLNEERILIYSLSDQCEKPPEKPIFQICASDAKYYAVALSERFIVVLMGGAINREVRVLHYNGEIVGCESFSAESNGYLWQASNLVAIHETSDRTWIAIGGRTKQDKNITGSIKLFYIENTEGQAILRSRPVSFNRPKPNPLALDFLRTLDFSPDGKRLVCATNNNRVLVWRLSDDSLPCGAPFIITRDLKPDIKGGRISSVTMFHSPLSRPYVLCTTLPSIERVINKGEWSFISPVGTGRTRAPDRLIRDLIGLKSSGHILTGTIAPRATYAALVKAENNGQGRLIVMPLVAAPGGGLSTRDPIVVDEGVMKVRGSGKTHVSPTAIRFHETSAGFSLIAVDIEGKIIKSHFGG